jgi:hypothetical protein
LLAQIAAAARWKKNKPKGKKEMQMACSKSPAVHANCDTCGNRPEIIHKPAGTGGALSRVDRQWPLQHQIDFTA